MLDVTVKPFAVAKAIGHKPRGVIRVDCYKTFASLPHGAILNLFNSFTPGLPVLHFADRDVLLERTWKLVKSDVLHLSPVSEEENMADETKAAATKTKAAAKKTAEKKPARKPGEETPVVAKIVKMMQRKNGATKAQIAEALPETKGGYINALLSRILKEKGYKLESKAIEGERAKAYFITGLPKGAAAATESAEA